MSTIDEVTDWQRAIAGDADAFGRIFDALHTRVYLHALRLTANQHDAEDVVAAAFLEMWRRRKNVRVVGGSVLPWLLVTTSNFALNHRRSLRRYQSFLSRLPRQEPTHSAAEEMALYDASLAIDPNLIAGIKALSGVDQQLLALVVFEDCSLRTAAEALGLSEQATRSRWQRIKRQLIKVQIPEPLLAVEN